MSESNIPAPVAAPAAEAAPKADASQAAPSQEALQQAINDPSLSKKEKESLKKKFNLKIDGEEFEEEIDLGNEEELKKRFQLAKVAQKRMQETSQYKKAIEQFEQLVKTNPDEALAMLGFDPLKYSEERIQREIEERKKSPEQVEKERIQKELEKYKKEMENIQKQQAEAEISALQEKYHRQIEDEIVSAIDSSPDLPRTPYFVKRVATVMIDFIKRGRNDVTAAQVVPLVKKQIKEELSQMYDAAPEDLLENMIGKHNFDRLRKSRLKKVKEAQKIQTAKSIKATGNNVRAEADAAKENNASKISTRDFFKNLK